MKPQQSWDATNFERAEVFIPDLSHLVGKSISDVQHFIFDTYAATHHIAGVAYGLWNADMPEKSKYEFKDGLKYYFFGSNLADTGNEPLIPFRYWKDSSWWNGTNTLTDIWSSNDRAVLLKELDDTPSI